MIAAMYLNILIEQPHDYLVCHYGVPITAHDFSGSQVLSCLALDLWYKGEKDAGPAWHNNEDNRCLKVLSIMLA